MRKQAKNARTKDTRLRVNVMGALGMVAILWGAASPDWPVADAAMRGDVDAVRALLQQGADASEAQGDGMTGLHWAAQRGHLEMAELLITAGANVHAGTRIGLYTPLHFASRVGNAPLAVALLAAGSDVHAVTTNSGVTPLHLAAESGSADAIRVLVEHGGDANAREGAWDQTPLIFAAAHNRPEAIRTLLELGADASLAESVIEDVARHALANATARYRFYEALLEFRPDWINNDPTSQGWGPIDLGERPTPGQLEVAIRAAREGQRNGEVLDMQWTGAGGGGRTQASLVGKWGGLTPLLHAARAGHAKALLALLDGGADINQSSGDGTSPLLIAMLNGHLDLGLQLLARGADPNVASESGAAPLYAVINVQWSGKSFYPQPRAHEQQKTNHLEVMQALLEAGADPNVRLTKDLWWSHRRFVTADLEGTTPFFRAALGLDVAAMRLLVAHGADPSIASRRPDDGGNKFGDDEKFYPEEDPSGVPPVPVGGPSWYPIHAATGLGYDMRAANEHRHVPSAWLPALKYLVAEMGADVNARDVDASTPLHNAASRGDIEVVLYLVEKGADVMAVNRLAQTTVDMANSPSYNVRPFPEMIALLESLGVKNNQRCKVC